MKKNNTAEKTIQEAEKITKALKEGTEKSIRAIIDEAVSKLVQEGCNEEDEEDGYEVEDVDTNDAPAADETPAAPEDGAEADEEGAVEGENDGEEGEEPEADNADDEWADMEDYKVGDNDYDFTGVDGDEILKVYNKLGDDDQIFVKKEEDGVYSVKDDETGAEFVIELDPNAVGADAEDADMDVEDDFGGEGDDEVEFEFDDEEGGAEDELGDEPDFEGGEPEVDGADDVEIDINDDDEDKDNELNEENLGYTDSYQKDVFAKKFNMNEPADSKTTNDWDAGAPKGGEKPWAGKGDMKPFEKKVNECGAVDNNADNVEPANLEENGGTISSIDARHMKKGQLKQHRPNAPEYDVRKVDSPVNESIKKIVAKAKAIQAENKQYAAMVSKIKQSLYEAAVLNVNLGKLVDILVNETTTKDEKKKICERFNNAKTIAEGKALYNTIKSELNETKVSAPAIEKQTTANSSKILNETTIYQNNESNAALSLMERMDNLFKK